MFDKHYEEQTAYITLEGRGVYANSIPMNVCFLDKKIRKAMKGKDINIDSYMNVIFEKPQTFDGVTLEWKLRDDTTEVVLIDEKKLFVKGKHFWAYCVGIV